MEKEIIDSKDILKEIKDFYHTLYLKGKFSSGREGAQNSITISNKNNYQKLCFAFIFESFLCLFE